MSPTQSLSPNRPDVSENPPGRPRLQLTVTQVAASALAAVTATIAASYLGVAGTVIGAAIASMLTVIGNAVYGHSLARTRDRVRAVVPMPAPLRGGPAHAPTAAGTPSTSTPSPERVRRQPWTRRQIVTRLGFSAVGVFLALLVGITGLELATGKPISDLLRGKDAQGTSVLGSTQKHSSKTPTHTKTTTNPGSPNAPRPTTTVTVTPTTVTVTPTKTVTPSQPPTTSGSSSSSAPTSPSPGGGATTSG
jgi:hypothetical protein